MIYDLDNPPAYGWRDEQGALHDWRDEQDRSEWFEEAAFAWRAEAERAQKRYVALLDNLSAIVDRG